MWPRVRSFRLAWLAATFVAAAAYLVSSMVSLGRLYHPHELLYGLALEMLLTGIAIPMVAVPLIVVITQFRIAMPRAVLLCLITGAVFGAYVFDYVAGGGLEHALLGGAFPGVCSGAAFAGVLRLTRQV